MISTRSYDGLDRLTSEVSPRGSVSYSYDAAGRRTGMTVSGQAAVTYQYDNANRLTQVTQGTSTVAIQPDSDGRRQSVTLPNGVTMTYGYDAASQLTGINYTLGGNTLGNLTYAYDLAGRRIRVSGFVLANPDRTNVGGSFARTGMPNALTSTSYNVNNQLTQFGGASLTYDANGNLTSDGTNTYTWNARNQLVSISGGVAASFQYDARVSGFVLTNPERVNGRRVSKTVGGTTQYVYDGANPVQEISGTTASGNLLTGGVDEYFQRTDSAGSRNYLTDALGSTLALVDSAGTIQTSYTFEPFGNATVSGASTTNSFAFTGRELDTPNLYFYRARYYSPQIQRFIGEDPAGLRGGFNKYAYVGNIPTKYLDPSGMDKKDKANKTPPTCPDGETPVAVDPFTNAVFQAGGNYSVANGSLSYVPSTGNVYGTVAVGNPGVGAFVGAGPTTNLDQSGPTVGFSGFAGLGGGVSFNPLTGDRTDLYGIGTPGFPTVSGGYTKRLGGVTPAVVTVCVTAIDPSVAVPIGDGLYVPDVPGLDYWPQ